MTSTTRTTLMFADMEYVSAVIHGLTAPSSLSQVDVWGYDDRDKTIRINIGLTSSTRTTLMLAIWNQVLSLNNRSREHVALRQLFREPEVPRSV